MVCLNLAWLKYLQLSLADILLSSGQQLTDKICGVSDDNEEHIKAQARAYRNLIYKVCLIYIKNAIKSYKATLIQELSKGGSEDLAKIIKGI